MALMDDILRSGKPKNNKVKTDREVKDEIQKRKELLEIERGERMSENAVLRDVLFGENKTEKQKEKMMDVFK
jgi:hypothetical protein